MVKKKKKRQGEAALKGWKTRRKNQAKGKLSKRVAKLPRSKPEGTRKKRANQVKSHRVPAKYKKVTKNDGKNRKLARKPLGKKQKNETKKSTQQKRVKEAVKKSARQKPKGRKIKSLFAPAPKRSNRAGKRPATSAKKKKAKKSNRAVSGRTKRKRKKPAKQLNAEKISKPKTSNRTYLVTVQLASGKMDRKRPLDVIVWAKDGLKDQEVIELLWAMIKRRRDKNLMFALNMEVRELIVVRGPLTDRLQGYRMN